MKAKHYLQSRANAYSLIASLYVFVVFETIRIAISVSVTSNH